MLYFHWTLWHRLQFLCNMIIFASSTYSFPFSLSLAVEQLHWFRMTVVNINWLMLFSPTDHFRILEQQNSPSVFPKYMKCTDFEALKLWKGQSGSRTSSIAWSTRSQLGVATTAAAATARRSRGNRFSLHTQIAESNHTDPNANANVHS